MFKKDLILDIETIPDLDPAEHAKTIEITPPGNYKSKEAIGKYIAQKRRTIVDDITKAASLNPIFGKVVSVAMTYDGISYSNCSNDEGTVLGYLETFIDKMEVSWESTRLITYNGKAFDVPFINIRAQQEILPEVPKYQQDIHLDMYLYVTNFGQFSKGTLSMSQASVARQLGAIEGVGTGADVYGWYVDGRLDKIEDYNMRDVTQLEDICKRLGVIHESTNPTF